MTEEDVKPPLEGLTEEEKTDIISNAVKDIEVQDILVCGKCHEVYHILDEFKEHKENEECKGNGEIKETLKDDKKPQIWAFTLWKNTKFKNGSAGEKAPTSWNIYQTWRAMKPKEKDAWLTVASDMQGLFEIVSEYERSKIVKITAKNDADDKGDKKAAAAAAAQKPIILNKVKDTRRAIRTGSDPKVDHLVEKIMSKRYNPRKRTFEYLIKWEHFDAEKNTWEATANLQNCKNMLEEFDRNLQIQREQMKIQKSLEKKTKTLLELSKLSESRPQRTSKQKALNQVKAWCGAEADDGTGKRAYSDDSDEDEAYEKRMKVEESSSDSEPSPVVTIKRITKNGVEKKTTTNAQKIDTITLPENILIPDAKGIVRINQKQIPALSSGVYVMSKTAGIIKLDTAAASKLTSGSGQTVLKVAPKVGQTSIKLIKKEISNGSAAGKTTTIAKAIALSNQKPMMKNYSGKVYMQRRTNAQAAAVAAQAKKNDCDFDKDDKYEDESDGIEELEFPAEIQIPTADSPPPEFTLCPLTGKVVDKDGVAVKVENETMEEDSDEKGDSIETPTTTASASVVTSSNSLGNLVNLAAADILEDLTNSAKEDAKEEPMEIDNTVAATVVSTTPGLTVVAEHELTATQSVPTSPPPLTPTTLTMKSTVSTTPSTTSILSTALTNANIVRRGPPKLVPRTQPRPGILQAKSPRMQTQTVVTRVVTTGQARMPQVNQVRPGGTQIIRKRIIQTSAQPGTTVRTVVRQQPTRVYSQVAKSSPKVNQVNTYVATPATTNKVITIPPLVETTTAVREKTIVEKPIITKIESEVQPSASTSKIKEEPQAATSSTISFGDSDTPLLITGEDGTIYQVAGQNEDGQTILITHGDDGEQQCLLVAPENASLINQALMKPTVVESSPQEETQEVLQQATIIQEDAAQQQALTINTAVEAAAEEQTDESQVVAQIVSANPPSPGGSRKVVLMLPDGNFMMTEVTAEQYAALELDK